MQIFPSRPYKQTVIDFRLPQCNDRGNMQETHVDWCSLIKGLLARDQPNLVGNFCFKKISRPQGVKCPVQCAKQPAPLLPFLIKNFLSPKGPAK